MRRPLLVAQAFAPCPPRKRTAPRGGGLLRHFPDGFDGDTLDVVQIMKILPHRYPFLMLDRVTRIQGNNITALKNVTMNELFFQGHFPGHPILPGVLQLEAIAQAAGIITLKQAENIGKLAYFIAADNVKWRKPVRPGDTLMIEVELTKSRAENRPGKGNLFRERRAGQ